MCNINTNIGLTYKTAPCNHNSKPKTKQNHQSKCKNLKTDIKKPDSKDISVLKLRNYFVVIDEMFFFPNLMRRKRLIPCFKTEIALTSEWLRCRMR